MTEETKYLDTLFQSKFSGFEAEPPAHVWDHIQTNLHGNKGGSVNPVNLATLAALVLISGLLGFSLMKDAPHNHDRVNLGDQAIMLGNDNTATLAQYVPSPPTTTETASKNIVSAAEPSPAENHVLATENDRVATHNTQHTLYASTAYSPSFSEEARLSKMKTRLSFGVHTGLQALNSENIKVRDSKQNPRYISLGDNERSYNRKAAWQLGLLFTPAMTFYPDDSISNQRSYTLDASIKWMKNEFFVESGLGFSFSSDDGKYNIDYEKFLGSYDDVYNVTFDTTESGAIVPIYHTNVVDVYDSVSRFKVEKTKNHYTYLQIPVYVGFQKQVDRFGWFVKGGPIFSVLISENIPNPDAGTDKIIGLDQKMANRVNTYWQFAISTGISYQLSNKVGISIEPTFRYYLNSQYESKYISTRHPYSIGLRTGLLFNF